MSKVNYLSPPLATVKAEIVTEEQSEIDDAASTESTVQLARFAGRGALFLPVGTADTSTAANTKA